MASSPLIISSPVTRESYGRILKSTALVGGSSIITIGFGVIRTKAVASILGPAGFGLMGLYTSVADVVQTFAGMGLQSSGVRQIAQAAASGNTGTVERTAAVLRRTSVLFGLIGGLILVVFARPIAKLTFGSNQHAVGIATLSLVVLFREISAGQGALLQGMRRISDLATMSVIGAIAGTALGIPLIYWFREEGVVVS